VGAKGFACGPDEWRALISNTFFVGVECRELLPEKQSDASAARALDVGAQESMHFSQTGRQIQRQEIVFDIVE
jgi:hypothetical protein